MIADTMPHTGGAPEVIAMPIENGSEISATMKPDRRSYRQCFSPARPLAGFSTRLGRRERSKPDWPISPMPQVSLSGRGAAFSVLTVADMMIAPLRYQASQPTRGCEFLS